MCWDLHLVLLHMACFHQAGGLMGWQVAENDWSLWVARRLAVGIRYSDICWQAYTLTANTLTHWDITGTDFHYHRNVKLRNDISEDWLLSVFTMLRRAFLTWASKKCAYTETCCICFTVPRRWIVHRGEAWEQCPEEAEERVFYRYCAVRSADMQTWVCISFLLFSQSYKLHFPAEWGKVQQRWAGN